MGDLLIELCITLYYLASRVSDPDPDPDPVFKFLWIRDPDPDPVFKFLWIRIQDFEFLKAFKKARELSLAPSKCGIPHLHPPSPPHHPSNCLFLRWSPSDHRICA